MNHGSLFTGIGGFDLAAEWMGWTNIFQVEWGSYCQKVLKKNFKNIELYGDIKEFKGEKYRGTIDILTGGVPCQPSSIAGQRKGENDDRWLWPEMLRVVREVKPPFIICENPPGIISLGHGKPFASILSTLENEGYQIELFIIPACGIQAPHKRDRVWIIAYSDSNRKMVQRRNRDNNNKEWNLPEKIQERKNKQSGIIKSITKKIDSDTNISGFQIGISSKLKSIYNQAKKSQGCKFTRTYPKNYWSKFPTQSPFCGRNDGISNRVHRVKGLGNAIVPQVAFELFKAIETVNNLK